MTEPKTTGWRMEMGALWQQCFWCRVVKACPTSINVAPDAASTGPAVMRPICEECAANAR
jgi:hypothetical protein